MATVDRSSATLHFGDYCLDTSSLELRKGGIHIRLRHQPAQVLSLLAKRPNQVVTREELQQSLWGTDTFVDFERGLNNCIKQIRQALNDDPENPKYVETLPRVGYRFIATVNPSRAAPELLEQTSAEASKPTLPASRGRPAFLWKVVAGGAVLAAATILFWLNFDKLRARVFARSRSVEIHSLAVLPLQNLSTDPSEEYFSEGITEALTTDLAQISALRVISRTSSEHFKGSRETLPEIARELNVQAVVEGSVTRSGNRVRITAQLIEAPSDRHLWARTYERDFQDILRMQDEVARDIASEIRISITPQEQARLNFGRKTSPSAYDAYLRGRYLWSRRNAESIDKAVSYFQQAIREDPDFAPAYSGLADCYWIGWGAKVDLPLADQYAQKTISLQPELAEGHASLGVVRIGEHQMSDAERELKRAIELNPNYAMAHHYYAGYLVTVGRSSDALEENDRAKESDPFSIAVNTMRISILIGLRRYEQAIEQAEKATELSPQSANLYKLSARIYWLEGKAPEAISEERKLAIVEHFPERLRVLDEITATYEKSGFHAAQLKDAQFMERAHERHDDMTWAAYQYGNLQNKAKALWCLEESYRTDDDRLILSVKTAPEFDFLHQDPRFQNLLQRLNLQ